MAPMNETKIFRIEDFARKQSSVEPESLTPDRPPYLLRARVAGDTIRDLIEALQQLDPDLKHGVEEVVRTSCGMVDGLGVDPESFAKRVDGLEEELSDEQDKSYRLREALEDIRDADQCSVQALQNIAREALQ